MTRQQREANTKREIMILASKALLVYMCGVAGYVTVTEGARLLGGWV